MDVPTCELYIAWIYPVALIGMSLADFKIVIQPQPVVFGIQARFPTGNVVHFQSSGVHCRGTLKWAGFLPSISSEMAGIELVSVVTIICMYLHPIFK